MGGLVAEKLFLGPKQVTAGCSSDLKGATDMAYQAVRRFGMFGQEAGYISSGKDENSDAYNAMIDQEVKRILDESYKRVESLLKDKEQHIRNISKNLYWYDYLTAEEMDSIIKGKQIKKEKVREWEGETHAIKF